MDGSVEAASGLIIYGKQGTDEWVNIKAKKITASVIKTLFVKGKGSSPFGSAAIGHAKRIALERISGNANVNSFFSKPTQRGLELEDEARKRYEREKFTRVTQCMFVDCGTYGCSPDGLIDEDDGMMEIKVYSSMVKHFDAVMKDNKDHDYQIKFQLFCTGRAYCDYVSYYPETPEKTIAIKRYYPDKMMNIMFSQKIAEFNLLVENLMDNYRNAK